MTFVIRNQKCTEFWSNENGWGCIEEANVFSEAESAAIHLPVGGSWVRLWECNQIQFARFIAECEACGVFCNELLMNHVANEMDLDMPELFQIVSRAQEEFDDFVHNEGFMDVEIYILFDSRQWATEIIRVPSHLKGNDQAVIDFTFKNVVLPDDAVSVGIYSWLDG